MSNSASFETSKRERNGYYSYFVGQNIIYMFVTMFMGIYYTNFLGIPPLIVGNIMLGARIFDALNDPIISILVEKANFKNGKFMPWIKSVVIAVPIATIAMFMFHDNLSGMSLSVRVLYASVTYVVWGVLYTISDAPAWALSTVMTSKPEERNVLMTYARLTAMVGIILANTAGNMILVKTNNNWFMTAVLISFAAFLFLFPVKSVKERVQTKTKTPTLKEILLALFTNKYLVVFVIANVIATGTNLSMTFTPYVATDLLKNPAAISILSLMSVLPTLIIIPFMSRLVKAIGKNKIFIFSLVFGSLVSVIQYVTGYDNLTLFYTLSAVKGLAMGPTLVLGAMFFGDCVEYYYYTKGNRFEAATFAAQTFTTKFASAMAGTLGMWLLAAVGYVTSTKGETVQQAHSTLSGMWSTYTIVPAIGGLVAAAIFALFYKLKDEDINMMAAENKLKIDQIKESNI